MQSDYLPYARQAIDEEDIQAVTQTLKSEFLTTGPMVDAFENELSRVTTAQYAVVCSNGTAALHLAYLANNIGPGDGVVVPATTFLATANAVRMCGGDVIFADVDADNGLMSAEHLEQALKRCKRPVKAVVPVHLAGQVEDLTEIARIAKDHGMIIIEDACHALGSFDKDNHPVGGCTHSQASCFSFHPAKTIAMGEGGAITTNNAGIAKRLKELRQHGMYKEQHRFTNGESGPWYYEMSELGFNYRANDIQCALGLSQLKKLHQFRSRRQELFQLYEELLAPFFPFIKVIKRTASNPCWHLAVVLIDFTGLGTNRTAFANELSARGIGSQVHYFPVHQQPYYKNLYGHVTLPGAETYYQHALSLPLYPSMSRSDVERVVQALTEITGQKAEPL